MAEAEGKVGGSSRKVQVGQVGDTLRQFNLGKQC